MRFTATIKRESNTDVLGKKKRAFGTTIGSFRCDLVNLGASEVDYGEGTSSVNLWEVRARWQAIQELGLLETDILQVDGKTLYINGIENEDNRDRLALINATEVR